ncbi:COQ10A [Symbiodinium sp. KB8]|nr:COQ10A [Symbiodinium sp. KB8]
MAAVARTTASRACARLAAQSPVHALHRRWSWASLGSPAPQVHQERRLMKHAPETMYAVVADVANYKHFVPWCVGSRVLSSQGSHMEAEMTVGFRMFTESYISKVKLDPPRKAIAKDTQLFRHLQNTWLFEPGPDPNTTWLHFSVDFQFRSMLYSQASGLFLNEVAHRMVHAFDTRAAAIGSQAPSAAPSSAPATGPAPPHPLRIPPGPSPPPPRPPVAAEEVRGLVQTAMQLMSPWAPSAPAASAGEGGEGSGKATHSGAAGGGGRSTAHRLLPVRGVGDGEARHLKSSRSTTPPAATQSAVATAVSLNRDKASRSKAGSSNASQAQALLACTLSAPVLNVASVLHCPSTSSSTFTSVAHWFLKEKPHKSLLGTMTSTLNMLRSSLSALLVDVSQCRTRMMHAMQQIPPTPRSHQAHRSHNQLP